MKKLLLMINLLFLATSSWALLPPKYLSVPQWQSCTATETRKTATFYCLPKHKPKGCPESSWQALTQEHLMDRCARRVW